MNTEPMVTIICSTYNHESYIADALEGFMMQKTDFPVECLVLEDCSTDGTLDVIRTYQKKYPGRIDVIRPPRNTKGKILDSIYTGIRGKYIAYCEGDDYWIDEYKLQKQVDYMEEHPTCAFCGCNSYFLDQRNLEGSRQEKKMMGPADDRDHLNVQEFLENRAYLSATAGTMIRNYREDKPRWSTRYGFGDIITILQSFKHGYMHYSGEVGAIYRIHVPGSWNGKINALTPKERAIRRIQDSMETCEVLEFFNYDTGYVWNEAIQTYKNKIRSQRIAWQSRFLLAVQADAINSWQGIFPVISSVLIAAGINKEYRQIVIWGLGEVGSYLADELSERGWNCRLVDKNKTGVERPETILVADERYFVIVTMMRGYSEVESQLQTRGYKEWKNYICLSKFTEIWWHFGT